MKCKWKRGWRLSQRLTGGLLWHDRPLAPITVNATDPNGDTLIYSATITGPGTIAAGVRTSAGLLAYVPGFDGYHGLSEKWFSDNTGHPDYLRSDGTRNRVVSVSGRTITGSTYLGSVDTSF